MGFISQATKAADKQIGRSPADAGEGRRLWREVFDTTKEEGGKQSPRSAAVPGGSYGRSITSSDASFIRLLQAMRSMAPGGWSDDLFSVVFPCRGGESPFWRPSPLHTVIDVCVTEFFDPFANGLRSSVDGGRWRSLISSPNWDGEGVCNRPPSFDPCGKRGYGYAAYFGPFGQAVSFPVVGEDDVSPGVPLLGFCSCPPAIARLVVSAVILPVKRMTGGRTWAHVLKEVAETAPPSVADLYAPPTVVGKAAVGLFAAPFSHVDPCLKFSAVCSGYSCWPHGVAPDYDWDPYKAFYGISA